MKLSDGQESTLGSYESLTKIFFGENSKPHKFILDKINDSENGRSEEVLSGEQQMIQLFASMIK